MTEIHSSRDKLWTEDTRMSVVLMLVYALAIPIILGLISGINESGTARMVSKEAYMARYTVRGLLSWWTTIAITFGLVAVLRPWKPSFLVILVLAPLVSIFLNGPLSLIWQPLFEPYLAEGSEFYPLWPWRYGDPEYLREGAFALLTNEIVWVSFNIVFQRSFHVSLYGFPPPRPKASRLIQTKDTEAEKGGPTNTAWTAFTDRIPKDVGTDIVALEAQEHYTKVYTRIGAALVLHRFGDAVKAMTPTSGLQVHRSYWIAKDAIAAVDRSGRTYEITLDTGLKVPVSRSYKIKVDDLNLSPGETTVPSSDS